jgi:hypothetical protein
MGEVDPIDVGATIDAPGTEGRIVNIWIDEDGEPQITIRWEKVAPSHDPDEKVSYSDLREMLEWGEIERTNTGHEAWEWRAEHIDA